VKGPPAAFQAEDRGVRLSLPAPIILDLNNSIVWTIIYG